VITREALEERGYRFNEFKNERLYGPYCKGEWIKTVRIGDGTLLFTISIKEWNWPDKEINEHSRFSIEAYMYSKKFDFVVRVTNSNKEVDLKELDDWFSLLYYRMECVPDKHNN